MGGNKQAFFGLSDFKSGTFVIQGHQIGWAGAICPSNSNSSHFFTFDVSVSHRWGDMSFHGKILSQGWWRPRQCDKGKRIQRRCFSPPPREWKQSNRTLPTPKPTWCTHGGTDSARRANCTTKKWGRSSSHAWVPISARPGAPHRGHTDKRYPNLAKYNTYLEKKKKCSSALWSWKRFRGAVAMWFPAHWRVWGSLNCPLC